MRKSQSSGLWGISAILIALVAVVGGALWFSQQRRLAAEKVEGAREQGSLRLRTRHRTQPVVTPPPSLLMPVLSFIGYQWYHPAFAYSLEIVSALPVRATLNTVSYGRRAMLPISEYTATAVTPSGKKFSLNIGLEPSLRSRVNSTGKMPTTVEGNVFFVLLPESVPETVDYLDVTVTGRGETATWRVKDLPPVARQVTPPEKTTTALETEGIAIQAAAWCHPEGREDKVWIQNGMVIGSGSVLGMTNPPIPGATLQPQRVELDTIQAACWMSYTVPITPNPLFGRVDDNTPVLTYEMQKERELRIDSVELEWGKGRDATVGSSSYSRGNYNGSGRPSSMRTITGTRQQCTSPAMGGEQKWARITGRLDWINNNTVRMLFLKIPIRQTPEGPRLNVGEGRTLTTTDGLKVRLTDPTRPTKRKKPRIVPAPSPPQTTYSPSGIPIKVEWSIVEEAGGKNGTVSPIDAIGAGMQSVSSPFVQWRDSAGNWNRGAITMFSATSLRETQGSVVYSIPTPSGNQINALSFNISLRRKVKSMEVLFTVPIQVGFPANLPQELRR